ncbi:AraC family transcriptional regulator [Exilibacterium tricleocarpae]|uniref:AraC family transcriptional regulator n=1 Tax=Exilibacterium tricleocarpae TaxID=2591008 RepID=A0A545SYB9_9GAMM|nr:AraC family transcriptional regulator [Exilibacterium tricleocarpae]
MLFNVHDVVLLMTAYQCTLFALLLVAIKSDKHLSNLLLAGFLLTHAAIPLDILINFGVAFREWATAVSPKLSYLFGFAYWLEGPLLLWYTRSLLYRDYRLGYGDLVYLIPFFVYLVYELAVYYWSAPASKIVVPEDYGQQDAHSTLNLVVGFCREALRVAFGVLCFLEIRRGRQLLKHRFSNIEKIDFSWLNILVIGFLLLRVWAVLVSIAIIVSVKFGVSIDFRIMGLVENYTVFILVSALIFFSLSYSAVFEGIDEKGAQDGHGKSAIDPQQVERLSHFMETEKPFLKSALTLEQLASQAAMPARTLSMVINRHFNKNFFEFINHYRIEETKQLLRDPQQRDKTLLEIMLAVGFNSKATFNTFFKKFEGMTPSQYRKKVAGEFD